MNIQTLAANVARLHELLEASEHPVITKLEAFIDHAEKVQLLYVYWIDFIRFLTPDDYRKNNPTEAFDGLLAALTEQEPLLHQTLLTFRRTPKSF